MIWVEGGGDICSDSREACDLSLDIMVLCVVEIAYNRSYYTNSSINTSILVR